MAPTAKHADKWRENVQLLARVTAPAITETPVSPPAKAHDSSCMTLPPPRRETPIDRKGGANEEEKEHDVITMEGEAVVAAAEKEMAAVEVKDLANDAPMKETAATVQSMNLQEVKRTLREGVKLVPCDVWRVTCGV